MYTSTHRSIFHGRKHQLRAFFVIALGILLHSAVQAEQRFVLSADAIDLGEHLELLEDESATLTIHDLLGPPWADDFVQSTTNIPNFPPTTSAWWARVQIHNPTSSHLQRLLEVGSARNDSVDLYILSPDGSLQHQSITDETPLRSRPYPSTTAVFPVNFPPDSQRTLYVRVTALEPLAMPVTLWKTAPYQTQYSRQLMAYALVLGVLLVMGFYHFSHIFILQNRDLLWYVLTLLCIAGFLLFRDRLILEILPGASIFSSRFTLFFSQGIVVFHALFILNFLRVAQSHPQLARWAKISLLPMAYWAVGSFFPKEYLHHVMVYILVAPLPNTLLMGTVLVKAMRKDNRWDTRFALIGQVITYCAGVLEILILQGLFETLWIRNVVFPVAFTLQVLFYAYALAERTRALRREKEQAQQNLIAQLQRLDELKDTFLTNTTHELKMPLQGILSLVESLKKPTPGTTAEKELELMILSARRLSTLVDDILDAAALQEGKLKIDQAPLNLSSLVAETVPLIEVGLQNRPIQLETQIPESLPLVWADFSRLQQVLLNVMGNASQFAERGTILLQAEVQAPEVKIAIIDTSSGMSPEQLDQCLQPFQGDGTGLGLFLSQQLVEVMDGSLHIHSAQGQGCAVEIRLPLAPQSTAESTAPLPHDPPLFAPSPPLPLPATFAQARALLVEDDLITREALQTQLHLLGLEVVLADSGEKALAQLQSHDIDVVLLDWMLPEMSGCEVCQRIRDSHTEKQLPVILLTARSQLDDLRQGYQAGANDYLIKPVESEELTARLRAHLIGKFGQVSAPTTPDEAATAGIAHETDPSPHQEKNLVPNSAEFRAFAVEALNLALLLWQTHSGLAKRDLAEQSGLWRVHMESRGVFRTRQLDRYLDVTKLPNNPKWNKMLQTVHFVWQNLPEGEDRQRLLTHYQDMLRALRQYSN
jgi:signal transduction histidine kinase/DNA-binding response OmpR family regulator